MKQTNNLFKSHPTLKNETAVKRKAWLKPNTMLVIGALCVIQAALTGQALAYDESLEDQPRSVSYTYRTDDPTIVESVNGSRTDLVAQGLPDDITTYDYDTPTLTHPVTLATFVLPTNLKSVTNALGQVTQYFYEDAQFPDQVTRMIDPNNLVTHYYRNFRDGIWKIEKYEFDGSTSTAPSGDSVLERTLIFRNDAGNIYTTQTASGNVIFYEYNDAQYVTKMCYVDGIHAITYTCDQSPFGYIQYHYDLMGNVEKTEIFDANTDLMFEHQQVFNDLNQVVQTVNGDGQTTSEVDYHVNGQAKTVTDGNNHDIQNSFDAINRVTSVLDPEQHTASFTYTINNLISEVTDQRGLTTYYEYNAYNEVTIQHSPDTGTQTFQHDQAGNVIEKTWNRYTFNTSTKTLTDLGVNEGITETYQYDALNRLTNIHYSNASDLDITYTYGTAVGEIGFVTKIEDASGQMEFEYNLLGAVTQVEQQYDATGTTIYTTTYDYGRNPNAASSLWAPATRPYKMTYPSGREVVYEYDLAGRINKINDLEVEHTPYGPISKIGLTDYEYDQAYRIEKTMGGYQNIEYDIDANNNIIDITNHNESQKTRNYGYDSLNRLLNETGEFGSFDFNYDSVGNRVEKKQTDSNNSIAVHECYQYKTDSNQLDFTYKKVDTNDVTCGYTHESEITKLREFTYDAQGQIISDEVNGQANKQLTYDAQNRLVQVSKTGGQSSSQTTDYLYNALGLRTQKNFNGKTELYHYDLSGKLIAISQVDSNNSNAQSHLVYEVVYLGDKPVIVAMEDVDIVNPKANIIDMGQTSAHEWNDDTDGYHFANGFGNITGYAGVSAQYFDDSEFTIETLSTVEFELLLRDIGTHHGIGIEIDGVVNPVVFQVAGDTLIADANTDYQYDDSHTAVESYQLFKLPVGILLDQHLGKQAKLFIYSINHNQNVNTSVWNQVFDLQICAGPCGSRALGQPMNMTGHVSYPLQDRSETGSVVVDETGFYLSGDRWRMLLENFDITANTYLEFDFESDGTGEIQGISIDDDLTPEGNNILNLAGSQTTFSPMDTASIKQATYNYTGGIQHYSINLATEFGQGNNRFLTLINDNDNATGINESWSRISNIRICDGPCGQVQLKDYNVETNHLNQITRIIGTHTHGYREIWNKDYNAFGEVISNNGEILTQPLLFPGQRTDNDTGYVYNYFRDYDPSLGRYIQSDPIGLSGGLNTYGYVNGNPVNLVDSYGLYELGLEGGGIIRRPNVMYGGSGNIKKIQGLALAGVGIAGATALDDWLDSSGETSKIEEVDRQSKCLQFYRGDYPGKTEFYAHESGRLGQERLENEPQSLLMQEHLQSSEESPFISITPSIESARHFGEVYSITIPVGMAFPNTYNDLNIDSLGIPEDEWLVPLHIPSKYVNNPNCTCE